MSIIHNKPYEFNANLLAAHLAWTIKEDMQLLCQHEDVGDRRVKDAIINIIYAVKDLDIISEQVMNEHEKPLIGK